MYVDAAPEFQALDCDLFVVNTSAELGEYAQTFKEAGYKVFHFPYPGNFVKKWKYYYVMTKLVKKYHIDVIHIHRSDMKWGMAFVAKMAGVKSVYTIHNCFVSRFFTKPCHIWLRWSAIHLLGCKFQSISDSVYDNERAYYHTATTLIYNWYGNKRFFPATNEERLSVRKELGIKANTLAIVSVGGALMSRGMTISLTYCLNCWEISRMSYTFI